MKKQSAGRKTPGHSSDRDDAIAAAAKTSGRAGFWWGARGGDNFGPYRARGGNFGPYGERGSADQTERGGNFGPYGRSAAIRRRVGMGYHPDLPDMRDYCVDSAPDRWQPALREAVADVVASIKEYNARSELFSEKKKASGKAELEKALARYPSFLLRESDEVPMSHDLRETGFFTPVEDQGAIGSCTAQAVIGLIEYLMRSGGTPHPEMSRMFLYKVTRRLLGWTGDTGAYLRTAIKAMVLFGVPPESEWPYVEDRFDDEPEAYHFAFAQNFKATVYARLDGYGATGDTLGTVKRTLLDGFPVAFGFPVYTSIDETGRENGFVIPIPRRTDRNEGGHAVLAVGYDDEVPVGRNLDGQDCKGALIIRNSWTADWGDGGYAYLPYEYVTNEWAVDFWTVFNKHWLDLDRFR